MRFKNDECAAQSQVTLILLSDNTIRKLAYLNRGTNSLLTKWLQDAGLLKFPIPFLSFSLSLSLILSLLLALPPLFPNSSLALKMSVATPYFRQCTFLFLSRILKLVENLFTKFVLTVCKLHVGILSVTWDDNCL